MPTNFRENILIGAEICLPKNSGMLYVWCHIIGFSKETHLDLGKPITYLLLRFIFTAKFSAAKIRKTKALFLLTMAKNIPRMLRAYSNAYNILVFCDLEVYNQQTSLMHG